MDEITGMGDRLEPTAGEAIHQRVRHLHMMPNKGDRVSRHLVRRHLAVTGVAAVADLEPRAAECGQVLTNELLMVPGVGH